MAKLSQLAYLGDDVPDREAILDALTGIDADFKTVEGFGKNSSQGIVVGHSRYITAAFRGTDEIGDWLDNLNVLPIDHPLGEVHRGFQAALDDI